MWDLIVSVPDHCLSFYFTLKKRLCWDTKTYEVFGPREGLLIHLCIKTAII